MDYHYESKIQLWYNWCIIAILCVHSLHEWIVNCDKTRLTHSNDLFPVGSINWMPTHLGDIVATIDISQTRTCRRMQSCFRLSTNHPDITTVGLCHKPRWSCLSHVLRVNQNFSTPCVLHRSSLLDDITPNSFILQTKWCHLVYKFDTIAIDSISRWLILFSSFSSCISADRLPCSFASFKALRCWAAKCKRVLFSGSTKKTFSNSQYSIILERMTRSLWCYNPRFLWQSVTRTYYLGWSGDIGEVDH